MNNSKGIIYIDKNITKSNKLLNWQGDPVMGISNEEIIKKIEVVAVENNFKIKFVDGVEINKPEKLGSYKNNKLVISIGDDLAELGELYAHLTNKSHVSISVFDESELKNLRNISTVIILPKNVSAELLEQIFTLNKNNSVPGIITATSKNQLIQTIYFKAAWAIFRAINIDHLVDFSMTYPFEVREFPNRTLLGVECSKEMLRQKILKEKPTVLNVYSHSDGIDIFFGNLVLCSINQGVEKQIKTKKPPCILNQFCHRFHIPLKEIRNNDLFVFANEIDIPIIIFNVCFGFLTNRYIVENNWGFNNQLMQNPGVGAIITTWQVTQSSPIIGEKLIEYLLNGYTTSEAVYKTNQSPLAKKLNTAFCLLGDPNLKLDSKRNKISKINTSFNGKSKTDNPKNIFGELSFLKHFCLQLIQYYNPKKEMNERAQKVVTIAFDILNMIDQYEFISITSLEENKSNEQLAVKIREETLKIIFNSGFHPYSNWSQFSFPQQKIKEIGICNYCHSSTKKFKGQLKIPYVSSRIVEFCPICGMIKDQPTNHSQIDFEIKGNGKINLIGLEKNNSYYGLIFYYHLRQNNFIHTFTNHSTIDLNKIKNKISPGLINLVLFNMSDKNQFGIVRKYIRAEQLF